MKQIVRACFLLLMAGAGCSNSVEKSIDESAQEKSPHDSPQAVVEALFSECQKEKPEKAIIVDLMSAEARTEYRLDERFDESIKRLASLKLIRVKDFTMHKSGKYANVHCVLQATGKEYPSDVPVIKVDGKWYMHVRYGEEKWSAKSSSSK